MRTGTIFALASSLALLAGCGTPGVHEADRGLEGTLRAQVNEKHVDIDVDHGVVELEGTVRTTEDRDRIERVVRSTPGVVAVKDELKVSLPAPGTYGAYPSSTVPAAVVPSTVPTEVVPSTAPVAVVTSARIPVYQTALPEPTSRVELVLPPAVLLPDYPTIKVQPGTADDSADAQRIADQIRISSLARSGYADVIITVRNGNVSLQGRVDTKEERDALIAAIQRAAGLRAIYDQLHVG